MILCLGWFFVIFILGHFGPQGAVGKEMLEERKEITLLGVILDNRMNFSSHFKKVYNKMKKGLNGLSMVKIN